MRILAIETSCDETAAAVIEGGGSLAARSGELEGGDSLVSRSGELEGGGESSLASRSGGSMMVSPEGRVGVLSNIIVSQADVFAEYGGVIPEVAARSHLEAILPVVHRALAEAKLTKDEIDAIAVTHTPGLLGSLLIGTLTARMLAILWGKPLYTVHHLKSHIYANWLQSDGRAKFFSGGASATPVVTGSRRYSSAVPPDPPEKELRSPPTFPLLALVVSGGHTQIIYMSGHNQFEIIGTTRDDAVGECFDKVAKILGLPYPGGPSIAKCAKLANSSFSRSSSLKPVLLSQRTAKCASFRGSASPRISSKNTSFLDALNKRDNYRLPYLPKPRVEGLDFSFSGLKTAVLRAVQAEVGVPISTPSGELAGKLTDEQRADFAAAFQETAVEILVEKVARAVEERPGVRSVVLGGGVSANRRLRERMNDVFSGLVMGFETRSSRRPSLRGRASYPSGRCPADGLDNPFLSRSIPIYSPLVEFSGDNAAMVGAAAYFEIVSGVEAADPYRVDIMPRSAIG